MGRTEWTIIIGTLAPLKLTWSRFAGRWLPQPWPRIWILSRWNGGGPAELHSGGRRASERFLGSGQTLNTDDFPYLEYIAPRSAFGSSREGLAPAVIPNSSAAGKYATLFLDATDSSLEASKSYDSSSLVLNARLAEMTEPANHAGIHRLLDEP